MTRGVFCGVLFVFMAPLGCAQLSGTASLTGKVVHGQTNAPLAKVSLTLEFEGPPKATAAALTNAEGAFRFENLPAGDYKLFAFKQGFRRVAFGAKDSGQVGAFIKLGEASVRDGVDIKLPPTASISGVITEADGGTGPGFEVVLLRPIPVNGKMELGPFRNATTDERGTYRFSDVPPGRYYISANSSEMRLRRFVPGGDALRLMSLTTLYPGTRDAKDARFLDIRTGDRITGIDIAVQSAMSCRPKARLVLPPGVEPSSPPQVMFFTTNIYNRSESFGFGSDLKGGLVSLPVSVPPGPYIVSTNFEAGGVKYSGSTEVDLAPGETKEVTITPRPVFHVPCEVKFENVPVEKQNSVTLALEPGQNTARAYPRASGAAGGECRFSEVSEGAWKVRAFQLPAGLYAKSLMMGRQDIRNKEIALHETPSVPVTLVLASANAELSGEVEKSPDGAVQQAVILLSRTDPGVDSQPELHIQNTGSDGKFQFKNLPPGNYQAFAMEQFDAGPFRDISPLEAHAAAAKSLRLANGPNPPVTLKRIPAQ